ncbi:alpha/beta hydrolase [Mumia zhuanghuii]|uniref:Alpha/beta fold hydrolase n=2 Tax=Mumia TaxID=1546255 RepID=A0ABW1QMJ9_9ACTN|nr:MULTISPECIES: alpha/beta hydrolase [Mumia]KAA1424932.1 alpha/beta hydrolase [Mumia zhuanghuii]
MTTYILIPGAGGDPAYWSQLVPELERRGHTAIAVDIPQHDEAAGIQDHVQTVLDAMTAYDVPSDAAPVVVAQSMGAFIGPLVCARLPVELLVLLNPMIPSPGETAGEWWSATGSSEARREAGWEDFDVQRDFFHDVPDDLAAALLAGDGREPSERSFAEPWPASAWPDVPTSVIACTGDRIFPVAFQRRVSQERLGLTPYEMPGGHLVALSRPEELADQLEALVRARV